MSADDRPPDEDPRVFDDVTEMVLGQAPSYLSRTGYPEASKPKSPWRGFAICLFLSLVGLFIVPCAVFAIILSARPARDSVLARIALVVAVVCTIAGVAIWWHWAASQ